jgi:hypothetical protein
MKKSRKAKPNFAKRHQVAQIVTLLIDNIEAEEGGLVRYKNGYSDTRISTEVGVGIGTVQKWRTELHGKLIPSTGKSTLALRVTSLENLFAKLCSQLGANITED